MLENTEEWYLSGHMTSIQRRLNVDAMSWRCIDVETTLYRRHVFAGTQLLHPHTLIWNYAKKIGNGNRGLTANEQPLLNEAIDMTSDRHLVDVFLLVIDFGGYMPTYPVIDCQWSDFDNSFNETSAFAVVCINRLSGVPA